MDNIHFYSYTCSPFNELIHTIKNTIQSSSFLASCGAIFQSSMCSMRFVGIEDWKYYYWLIGLVSGLAILIEKKPRRSELSLYVSPNNNNNIILKYHFIMYRFFQKPFKLFTELC